MRRICESPVTHAHQFGRAKKVKKDPCPCPLPLSHFCIASDSQSLLIRPTIARAGYRGWLPRGRAPQVDPIGGVPPIVSAFGFCMKGMHGCTFSVMGGLAYGRHMQWLAWGDLGGMWHMAYASNMQWFAVGRIYHAYAMPVRHMLHICMCRIYVAYADAELEGFEAGR